MAYFAAVFTRGADGWTGTEVDLDVESVDDVADIMRDHAADGETVVLFTEEDDEWFAVVRLDADEPRAFISDTRAPLTSHYAEVLVEVPGEEPVEDDEGEGGRGVGGEPGGDDELLTDLGVAPTLLHDVSTREGLLPGDALLEIAESLGCGDAYERLR
ncbi:MAG TPA: tRNA adenosine deaminase-associated protein [Streptosporangiaceae bacterium]